MKRFKYALLSLIAVFSLAAPVTAFAADSLGGIQGGVNDACINKGGATSSGCSATTTSLKDVVKKIIDIFSYVIGAVSVIMIIYGGFRYITSGGESGAVGSAKNTILYAVIGLIIVIFAQVIVNFVISNVS